MYCELRPHCDERQCPSAGEKRGKLLCRRSFEIYCNSMYSNVVVMLGEQAHKKASVRRSCLETSSESQILNFRIFQHVLGRILFYDSAKPTTSKLCWTWRAFRYRVSRLLLSVLNNNTADVCLRFVFIWSCSCSPLSVFDFVFTHCRWMRLLVCVVTSSWFTWATLFISRAGGARREFMRSYA